MIDQENGRIRAVAWSEICPWLCLFRTFRLAIRIRIRSKMRRMGTIDHVSRFNKICGYREGWVFSNRFTRSLTRLVELTQQFRNRKDALQERKDRDLFMYI